MSIVSNSTILGELQDWTEEHTSDAVLIFAVAGVLMTVLCACTIASLVWMCRKKKYEYIGGKS